MEGTRIRERPGSSALMEDKNEKSAEKSEGRFDWNRSN
jgi:hypothetical protein